MRTINTKNYPPTKRGKRKDATLLKEAIVKTKQIFKIIDVIPVDAEEPTVRKRERKKEKFINKMRVSFSSLDRFNKWMDGFQYRFYGYKIIEL